MPKKRDNGKWRRPGAPKGRRAEPAALEEVRRLLGDAPRRRDLLIEYLHRIQDTFGSIAARHVVALAEELRMAPVEVFEVATFYHHFDVVKEDMAPPPALTVRVCDSVSCAMFGADDLVRGLEGALGAGVRVQRVPCVGRCAEAPVAVVGRNPVEHATVERVRATVDSGATEAALPEQAIDYESYVAGGGYRILRQCLQGGREVDAVIAELESSSLRGLGGAGFPTGRKWKILRSQAKPRLVAINIDEGEPGTFKDRYYLERDPHRFLEGMLIGAWAIEAEACYIYVRDEYPAVLELLRRAIADVESRSGLTLPPMELRRGAGAYICGEESAMIESIEGKRGMPRLRPPYVAEVGLFDRPTLEHNCETVYWVREILERGADWFAGHGRRGRKGLRSFSVSGRVREPGVHLAPAGISLRELIDEYCGGMLPGHELYGYFPGGASGGILPASLADEPLDFDTLQAHGCFIGSAAIIVLSDKDRARDAALNAMRFFAHESCGQCTPCRVGTDKAAILMEERVWDGERLEDLAQVMQDASICGLGQAAPNPLRCVLKYFPEEVTRR